MNNKLWRSNLVTLERHFNYESGDHLFHELNFSTYSSFLWSELYSGTSVFGHLTNMVTSLIWSPHDHGHPWSVPDDNNNITSIALKCSWARGKTFTSFQMMGAATEKARLPRFRLVLGIESGFEVDDLSCLWMLQKCSGLSDMDCLTCMREKTLNYDNM